ncbi:holin family protein [Endozoicomonas gorgoniicola]|uniref:Holin family protein n=1 Tax=Endozoicomonas gorgoniicola TaxID=1234144 RepID=A0ABT3MUD9_9GAMM|nr:holin family protein [Endozoicomonas gorgoniicola]MCW7552985.1 holin family protein [Endozoicomonas gorgoniicola]
MSLVAAIPLVGKVIDKLFPDAENRDQVKVVLAEMLINGELDELTQQAGVIKAEAQGEGWLQRSWRPIVMLVFTALVVCRWLGWSAPNLSEVVELKLFSIIQLGIGGYIASRGLEKVTRTWKG